MANKMVTRRQKLANAVQASVETHLERVGSALEGVIAPLLRDGESAPDMGFFQDLLGRLIEAHRDRMVAAEQGHLAELAGDIGSRSERDAAALEVRLKMVALRRILDGLFGPERSHEILAVEGPTARDPVVLLRQGQDTVVRMRSEELELPPQRLGQGAVLGPMSDQIEASLERLRIAIEVIDREQRAAQGTLGVKSTALASFDVALGALVKILEGLYELAGERDLAAKVRPLRRQRARNRPAEPPEAGDQPAEEAPEAPVPEPA